MATQIFFIFHPYLGKIPILTIFQMGWNHQLAKDTDRNPGPELQNEVWHCVKRDLRKVLNARMITNTFAGWSWCKFWLMMRFQCSLAIRPVSPVYSISCLTSGIPNTKKLPTRCIFVRTCWSYCWWKKSQNNHLGCIKPVVSNGILTISTGARRISSVNRIGSTFSNPKNQWVVSVFISKIYQKLGNVIQPMSQRTGSTKLCINTLKLQLSTSYKPEISPWNLKIDDFGRCGGSQLLKCRFLKPFDPGLLGEKLAKMGFHLWLKCLQVHRDLKSSWFSSDVTTPGVKKHVAV